MQSGALATIAHGVVLASETHEVAHVNPVAARLLQLAGGWHDLEEFNRGLESLRLRASNAERIAARLDEVVRDRNSRVSKWLWQFPTGPTHVHLSVAPLEVPSLVGRVWVFYDVSELYGALDSVKRLEHRLDHLLTEGDVVAFRLRRGGTFEWVSKSTTRLLGFDEDLVLGRSGGEFCYPEDLHTFYNTIKRLRQTGMPQDIGFRIRDAVGSLRTLEGRVFLADDGTDSVEVIMSDVTSHVELERLQALVVSAASHELKTPLAFVSTGLAALEEGSIDLASDVGRAVVDKMLSATKRLGRMSDEMLDLQSLEIVRSAVTTTQVPIMTCVERAASTVQVERDVHIDVWDHTRGVSRRVDGDLLEQAVINLTNNAVAHSPDGGLVEIVASVEDDTVRITVRDRGQGVPFELREHIFRPFVRLDRTRQGSGLGL